MKKTPKFFHTFFLLIKFFEKLFWELLPIIAVKEKQNKKNFFQKKY